MINVLYVYTSIKHNVTTIVHGFYKGNILETMHWNLLAENSRGWQEYWHKLVLRPRPFAHSVFLHCRCSRKTSYVSYHTETGIHNVSQKFLPEIKNILKVKKFPHRPRRTKNCFYVINKIMPISCSIPTVFVFVVKKGRKKKLNHGK